MRRKSCGRDALHAYDGLAEGKRELASSRSRCAIQKAKLAGEVTRVARRCWCKLARVVRDVPRSCRQRDVLAGKQGLHA